MQQPSHVPASMPTPPTNLTTEQIQKYLEENKQLILAILDNQNLGKQAECAQYQAQLQKNLVFLAAIADSQPQAPTVRPQMMMPHDAMHQGGHYMPQVPIFPPPRAPLNPQQVQEQQLHHQSQLLPMQGHAGMRPGIMNGMHVMRAEAAHGPTSSVDGRRSKQDASGIESTAPAGDGDRSSAMGH